MSQYKETKTPRYTLINGVWTLIVMVGNARVIDNDALKQH